MKKIVALYGAGNKSLKIESVITKYLPNYEVKYLIENIVFSKIGTKLPCLNNGKKTLDIISLGSLDSKYANNEIHTLVFPSSYHLFDQREILDNCLSIGIKNEDIYTMPLDIMCRDDELNASDVKRILVHPDKLEQFCHLDIHILDNCNCSCKACSHFSTLAPSEGTMITCEEFEKNISRLHTLIPNITSISVLGGEPLLHPDLENILRIARFFYRFSKINVTTNGIKLLQMTDKLVEEIIENNIHIKISLYPPFRKKVESWIDFLRKKQIIFSVMDCNKFERRLLADPLFDGKRTTIKCGHLFCMRGSCIGKCPQAVFVDYYNKQFGEILPEIKGVDIFEVESGLKLIEKLEQPLELCDYCCGRDFYHECWENTQKNQIKPDDWFMKL